MNRPNRKDYEFSEKAIRTMFVDFQIPGYLKDLEKYCDFIEKMNKRKTRYGDFFMKEYAKELKEINELGKENNQLKQELEKCRKALTKACKFMDKFSSCPLDRFDYELKNGCEGVCKERTEDSSLCWKEYLEEIEDE